MAAHGVAKAMIDRLQPNQRFGEGLSRIVRVDGATEVQMILRALVGVSLAMANPQIALAAEWRNCIAPSDTEHKVYMSAPFPTSVSLDDAQSAFGRMLTQSRLRHDCVQCPRGDDEQSALVMQQQAISFNRKVGNEITHLNWRP
jgi:hypothetical protein